MRLPSLLLIKMAEYIIHFESVFLWASDEQEAYEEARKLISGGDIKIDLIEEN